MNARPDLHSVALPARRRDELEFLPAVLEVLETPPAPVGRIIALSTAAFFALAVLWATIGTVDVVTVASGQIMPDGHIKVIQPLETGVIRAIHVNEGAHVEAGQALAELDPTETSSNIEAMRFDVVQAQLDEATSRALLSKNPEVEFSPPPGIEADRIADARQWMLDILARHRSEVAALNQEVERQSSVLRSSSIDATRLRATIPLIDERVAIHSGLIEKGLTQRSLLLSLQQEAIERRAELEAAIETGVQAGAAIASLQSRIAEAEAKHRADTSERLNDANRRFSLNEQSLIREVRRNADRTLRAPVSGTVNQLAASTIGGVVSTADVVMTIVPDDTVLEIEAKLLNKDVGFVAVGQPVEIKLDAFPFTRYGVVEGTLENVSADAVPDEVLGPVYRATVKLHSQKISVDGRTVALAPGMTAVAEIKTGRRRIIEFFLSPLLRYQQEAIRER